VTQIACSLEELAERVLEEKKDEIVNLEHLLADHALH